MQGYTSTSKDSRWLLALLISLAVQSDSLSTRSLVHTLPSGYILRDFSLMDLQGLLNFFHREYTRVQGGPDGEIPSMVSLQTDLESNKHLAQVRTGFRSLNDLYIYLSVWKNSWHEIMDPFQRNPRARLNTNQESRDQWIKDTSSLSDLES
ncbi:hypothetical protein ASPZODRAFT_1703006 [Penicilliopsis zonata CBS 506.65]|uniref:Uncharacterized protein n=1 Tax=Penicilliopsis zonata CBS 506.65 TaxID=1073090 RepID=A0A1L9SJX2_9EURO|nr:hypothetical protein ASPZODRAFT_1703006 [Penicilliopsis zonata CBS 506.65]OJJ47520.1 hypothetical protein ASPZODRAFT_1703006 [Penicilliopsis zonata CBS 506.65]